MRVSFLLLTCVFAIGCDRQIVRGWSSQFKTRGALYILDFVDPGVDVGVAFVFSNSIDQDATFDGSGRESLSLKESHWRVERTVRFVGTGPTQPIAINFFFDAKRNTFDFRGESYSLAPNQIAIVRFNAEMSHEVDVVDVVTMNDNTVASVTSEMR
jgi:hypothetical protein